MGVEASRFRRTLEDIESLAEISVEREGPVHSPSDPANTELFSQNNKDRQPEQLVVSGNVYISCKISLVCMGWRTGRCCPSMLQGNWRTVELASYRNGHRIRR